MCRHRVNAVLDKKILFGKINHHLDPKKENAGKWLDGDANSTFDSGL